MAATRRITATLVRAACNSHAMHKLFCHTALLVVCHSPPQSLGVDAYRPTSIIQTLVTSQTLRQLVAKTGGSCWHRLSTLNRRRPAQITLVPWGRVKKKMMMMMMMIPIPRPSRSQGATHPAMIQQPNGTGADDSMAPVT
jgi:hypothetical protein